MVKDSTDNLFIGIENTSSGDWHVYKSSDNGASWTEKKIDDGDWSDVGLVVNSSDGLLTYATDNPSDFIYGAHSTDGGITWSDIFIIGSIITDFHEPSCVVDSQDYVHCCLLDNNNDALYYVNNTIWDNEITVNGNTADDTDWCDIEVTSDDCIYIAAAGSDQDDVDIWSPCLNGWGDANRVQVAAGTSYSRLDISVSPYDDIYIASLHSTDLRFHNSSDGGSTWTTVTGLGTGYNPTIATNLDGDIYLHYYTTGAPFPLYFVNKSNTSSSWSNVQTYGNQIYRYNLIDSTFPSSNRLENQFHFALWDVANSNLNYSTRNITCISCTNDAEPPVSEEGANCTFPNSYSLNKEINLSWNCTVTEKSWCNQLSFVDDGNFTINNELNTTTISFANFDLGDKIYMSSNSIWYIGSS